jgi:hypothetical protein
MQCQESLFEWVTQSLEDKLKTPTTPFLPKFIWLKCTHSIHRTEMVSYQCTNTIFCHVFKVYVTKLPSNICITVWVLKANTSKTEMRKTGRKIPPRNTTEPLPLKSHPHSHLTMSHLCAALPYHLHDSTGAINHVLTIGLQADAPKRKMPPWSNGHCAMQMYKEWMHMYEGCRYLSISILHEPKWRSAGRSIGKVFQYVSRSKFCISSSHHPRITRPANHSLLHLTTLHMLGDLHKSLRSSIWNRKYCCFTPCGREYFPKFVAWLSFMFFHQR